MTTTSIKQTIMARTARTLTSARRVAMMLLTVMLTMAAQTAWAEDLPEADDDGNVTLEAGNNYTVSDNVTIDGNINATGNGNDAIFLTVRPGATLTVANINKEDGVLLHLTINGTLSASDDITATSLNLNGGTIEANNLSIISGEFSSGSVTVTEQFLVESEVILHPHTNAPLYVCANCYSDADRFKLAVDRCVVFSEYTSSPKVASAILEGNSSNPVEIETSAFNGKTLVGLGGRYLVKTSDGNMSVNNKDACDFTLNDGDDTYYYFITNADANVALRWNGGLHLEAFGNRSGDARFTVTKSDATAVTVSYSYESDPDGVHYLGGGHSDASFTMPAGDVTVSARAYMPVPYIDASGNSAVRREDYTILTRESGGDDLPGGWYVATGEFTIDKYLHFADNSVVHLILCDNAKITVNGSNKVIQYSNLTIYGQTNGTGSLTCNATSDWAIEVDNLTICGGHVTATTTCCDAIQVNAGDINLNGGTLTATANDGTSNGISLSGTLCLNGGTVESTGEIYAENGATITLASGKCYTDGTNIYTTSISSSDLEALGSVTLTPKKNFTLCTATVPDQTLGRFDPATNSYFKPNKICFLFERPYLVGEEVTDGETILTHGTDYVFGAITYASPDTRDYNTVDYDKTGDVCQVKIIGTGEYAGTKTVTFTIVDPSGTWGDKDELTWSMANGALSIGLTHPENSNKAMKAADNYGKYPWANYCGDVTSITIGEGVTSIAPYAFGRHYDNETNSYSNVRTVTLPSTLKSIGTEAFKGCSGDNFNSIVIPASVTSIGADAFYGCTGVTDVYCYADPTKLTWDEDGCDDFKSGKATKCHVADASAWSGFTNVNVNFVNDLTAASIPYIDADGNTQYCTNFTVLTNTTDVNHLDAGWYVVNDNVNYNSTVNFYDDVNLILVDGKTMNVTVNDWNAISSDKKLTIYGQSAGTGTLTATSQIYYGLDANELFICSGTVNATGCSWGIYANNVYIYGGTVNAEATDNGGIRGSDYISIYGGKVSAKGSGTNSNGIYVHNNSGKITLGGGDFGDYIYASSYNGTVTIADGKGYTDTNNMKTYLGTLTNEEKTAIAGKTLKPVTGVAMAKSTAGDITVTINPTLIKVVSIPVPVVVRHIEISRTYEAHKASTVFLPFSIAYNKVTGGTFNKFTGVDETKNPWEVTYTEVTSGDIKANTPYIFLPDGSNGGKIVVNNGDEPITVGTSIAGDSQTDGEWEFIGTHERIKWTHDTTDPEYTAAREAEIGQVYGFAAEEKSGAQVGQFVKVGNDVWINPERAYLKRTPAAARAMTPGNETQQLPDKMRVVIINANGETTEIGTLDTRTGEISLDEWYSLDGRRLNGKPSAKGIYIHNGNKVAIKN